MIQLTQNDIQQSGGLLSALSTKCAAYIRSLLPPSKLSGIEKIIKRHIVHTDPHLDEYFAELLFRSSIPNINSDVEFLEESIYSETNDLGAQQLWPKAVVFGIGSTVSCGAQPILLFDEHKIGKGKTAGSCSQVVADYIQTANNYSLPLSIQTLLKEINSIDSFGGAHSQHLGNIIKTLHNVRFLFSKGTTPKDDDIRDILSYTWKRSLIDACFVGVIYALENNVDLIGDSDSKKNALQESLKHYIENSLHKSHPKFDQARQDISNFAGNQKQGVFEVAFLKGAGKNLLIDTSGNKIPQLFLLSRICFACYLTWGEFITNIIMMHFWESEFQKQIAFLIFMDEFQTIPKNKSVDKNTPLGIIRKEILQTINIEVKTKDKFTRKEKIIKMQKPIWILNVVANGDVLSANKPSLKYITSCNFGCGIVLLENSTIGTKAIFKGSSFPSDKWEDLYRSLNSIEKSCWYDPSNDPNHTANFIVNGNTTHQYVKQSALDLHSLCEMVKNIFQ